MTYRDEESVDEGEGFHEVDPALHDTLIFEQAFKPGLEVEIEIVERDPRPARLGRGTDAPPRLARGTDAPPPLTTDAPRPIPVVALEQYARADKLEDDWFGSFDPSMSIYVDDEPTTSWRRFSNWVRSFKRDV
jgi:hypothetical protein